MSSPAPSTADRLAGLEEWHFWFTGRDQLVLNLLRRFRGDGTVLDLGCGTGSFAGRLGRARGRAVVLDRALASLPSPDALGVRGDVERLPCRDGSAGVVLARDVLEHIDDRRGLAECRRVLEPGGLLIALVPAWPSLWSRRDEQAGHLRRYTRSSLEAVLRTAGFRVLEMRGYQFALLPLVAANRLAARRRPDRRIGAEEHPSRVLNAVLGRVNRLEAALARVSWPRPPTGSSLVVVARRHDG